MVPPGTTIVPGTMVPQSVRIFFLHILMSALFINCLFHY